MNRSSLSVVIIPLVVVTLLIAGAGVYRLQIGKQSVQTQKETTATDVPSLSTTSGKPVVGFGSLQSEDPVADLQADYDGLADDGGASSLSDIEALAESL